MYELDRELFAERIEKGKCHIITKCHNPITFSFSEMGHPKTSKSQSYSADDPRINKLPERSDEKRNIYIFSYSVYFSQVYISQEMSQECDTVFFENGHT